MLRPMRNWLVIQPYQSQPDPPVIGALIVPEIIYVHEGEIIAAGLGRMGLKVGDIVAFGSHSGIRYYYQGKPLLIIREEEIYLVKEKGG